MQLRTCKNDPKLLQKLQTQLGTIRLLLIDEVSMTGANMMNDIDTIFKLVKNQPSKILVHFVLLGDFYQLPPVAYTLILTFPCTQKRKIELISSAGITVLD